MYYFTYAFPVGEITISETGGFITGCTFGKYDFWGNESEAPLILEAHRQLNEYFGGKRRAFELPLNPHGTEFQKRVWNALLDIPYGEIRSYHDIAAFIGNEKACRAVGGANNKNPIAIIIPCHRVIGKNGSLTGYAGGLNTKEFLIDLEKNHLTNL